jgi:hypothetical protein
MMTNIEDVIGEQKADELADTMVSIAKKHGLKVSRDL